MKYGLPEPKNPLHLERYIRFIDSRPEREFEKNGTLATEAEAAQAYDSFVSKHSLSDTANFVTATN